MGPNPFLFLWELSRVSILFVPPLSGGMEIYMEIINTILSGYLLPLFLMGSGIYFGTKVRFFYLSDPIRFFRDLKENSASDGISPVRALSQALAGTLGVGNMTGVASAICQGGAGAVFWMWISALIAMSIKYFEVGLAILCRRQDSEGYRGGAMYYIKDVFIKKFPKAAPILGGVFAVLCIANSLLTGNIVQVNSAVGAIPSLPPMLVGSAIALCALPVVCGKAKKVSSVTIGLIPFLSALYVVLCAVVIIPRISLLPSVFGEIFKGAFSREAVGGGVGGFLFMRAIRFGTTRGIFSNEAGSGTSPTAHASANAKSPHHQGCFGVFEVFADTIILCTLTAVVILLSDGTARGERGIGLTIYAFSSQAGAAAGITVGISVILFAFATVICQTQYGTVALQSISKKPFSTCIYITLSAAATLWGSLINDGIMWEWADMVISLMTVLNIICLLYASRLGYLKRIFPCKTRKP